MPGALLTTQSQIMCPHGGQAVLVTTNARVQAGAPVLLESDVHVVGGCPFTIGTKYSPCVRIEWSASATKATVGGVAPLLQTSVGKCFSPESTPQGVAIVVATQPRASAT
jgi:hypothetical protein